MYVGSMEVGGGGGGPACFVSDVKKFDEIVSI